MEQLNKEINQQQVAGNNSTQYQTNVEIHQGVSEERVRSIYNELIPKTLKEYSLMAEDIANNRIAVFANYLIPRVMEIDNAISMFNNPEFQILLKKAQLSAADTANENDYALLSELMISHIQKGHDRKNHTGISKAIEIVDYIDNDALCALTVAHALQTFYPVTGLIQEGLQALSDLYDKLICLGLPDGNDWLDHLDILGAIRISSFGKLRQVKDFYASFLDGYVCVGIKIGSEDYDKAIDILNKSHINRTCLVENELFGDYARLSIQNKKAISKVVINNVEQERTEQEQKALEEIWNMYSKDESLMQLVRNEFIKKWDSYKSLKQVRIWWDSIQTPFNITKVGEVLAHTNAKCCDSDLPDLI